MLFIQGLSSFFNQEKLVKCFYFPKRCCFTYSPLILATQSFCINLFGQSLWTTDSERFLMGILKRKGKKHNYITIQCSIGGLLIVLWSFLPITNPAMMVSDRWPVVILTANIHSSYLHIQKIRVKKWFLHSYHSVLLLIHSQVFGFNISIEFCYPLYIVFSFFYFFHSWFLWMYISCTRI